MRSRTTASLAVAAALLLGGCDDLLLPDRSGEVRVLVEGDASRSLVVITSNEFLVASTSQGPDGEVQFVQADTARVPPPFERTYDLAPTYLFAVRVALSPGDTGDVRLQVFLDGRRVWDEQSFIEAGSLIQFYMVRR